MSFATTRCRAALGVDAPEVVVETHLANGLPAFNIVGLPEKAVQESRDRVRSALVNSGFDFPARRITVNLAPADLPKQGSRFDLAIAIGILIASGQLPEDAAADTELVGELSLAGTVREISGVLPLALATRDAGRGLFVRPRQDGVRQTTRRADGADRLCLLPRCRPQAVIDRRHGYGDAGVFPPTIGQNEQRRGIGPARHREQQADRPFETREKLGERGKRRAGLTQHEIFLDSRSAARIVFDAPGYLRPISAKEAQACSLAPRALSDWPRRSMASGPREELA